MIDLSKKYKSKCGNAVHLYEIMNDRVFGRIEGPDGYWTATEWFMNGRHPHSIMPTLVEIKPRIKRTYWVNIYKDNVSYLHSSKKIADAMNASSATSFRIACIKIEIDCEEGEGL